MSESVEKKDGFAAYAVALLLIVLAMSTVGFIFLHQVSGLG